MKLSHLLMMVVVLSVPLWYAYRSIGAPTEIRIGQIPSIANNASQNGTRNRSRKRCIEDVAATKSDFLSFEAERKRYIALTKPLLESPTPSSATLSAEQFKFIFDVRYEKPADGRDVAEHLKELTSSEVDCAALPGLDDFQTDFLLKDVHEKRLHQSRRLLEQVERRRLMEELLAYWQDSFPRTREGQRQREHFKAAMLAPGAGE